MARLFAELRRHYLACVFGLTLLLVAICWWKGEKPEWRWGEKPRDPEAN